MSMARLVYVTCDRCGAPCGTGDDMADDGRVARATAKRFGWTRVDGEDVCPKCA